MKNSASPTNRWNKASLTQNGFCQHAVVAVAVDFAGALWRESGCGELRRGGHQGSLGVRHREGAEDQRGSERRLQGGGGAERTHHSESGKADSTGGETSAAVTRYVYKHSELHTVIKAKYLSDA